MLGKIIAILAALIAWLPSPGEEFRKKAVNFLSDAQARQQKREEDEKNLLK